MSSETVVSAWTRLLRAERQLQRAVERELKAAGMPSLAWYDALLELRRSTDGLRPFELERRLQIEQYNLSRLVDRLCEAGLAVKQPVRRDRRGHRLCATEAGVALLNAMTPVYTRAIERHLGARIEMAEASRLSEILDKLIEEPAH